MRMQVHQLVDALLFAVSFWLAYELRSSPLVIDLFHLQAFGAPFESFFWLYVILIPAGPLILEAQGFYRGRWCVRGGRRRGSFSRGARSRRSG